MKKRLKKFAAVCALLLAAYAAMDLISETYLQKTSPRLEIRRGNKIPVPVDARDVTFKLKDGSECSGILLIRNNDAGKPKIMPKDFRCRNFFILNARVPNFKDSMEIGKDYQREYNKYIPGTPPTPGLP